MKWHNHKAIGAGVSLLFGLPLSGVFITTVSSVLPDAVEFGLKHRGLSHAWWIYAFLYVVSIVIFPQYSIYFSFIALGVLLHLLCDALTPMGIPLSPFSGERITFKLFQTGSVAEYVVTGTVIAVCLYIFIKTGGISAKDPFLESVGELFKFASR